MKESLKSTESYLSPYESRIIGGALMGPGILCIIGQYHIAFIAFLFILLVIFRYKPSRTMHKHAKYYLMLALLSFFIQTTCGVLVHEYQDVRFVWGFIWIATFWIFGSYLDKLISNFNARHAD